MPKEIGISTKTNLQFFSHCNSTNLQPCIYASIAALIQHETMRIHNFTQKLKSLRVLHTCKSLFQLLSLSQTRNVVSCLCAYFLGKAVRNRTARRSLATPTPQTIAHKLHSCKMLQNAWPLDFHKMLRKAIPTDVADFNQERRVHPKCNTTIHHDMEAGCSEVPMSNLNFRKPTKAEKANFILKLHLSASLPMHIHG